LKKKAFNENRKMRLKKSSRKCDDVDSKTVQQTSKHQLSPTFFLSPSSPIISLSLITARKTFFESLKRSEAPANSNLCCCTLNFFFYRSRTSFSGFLTARETGHSFHLTPTATAKPQPACILKTKFDYFFVIQLIFFLFYIKLK
jgi:hypothetical protein